MPSRSALNQIRSSGPEPRRCGHFDAPNFPAGTTASFATESWKCRPASGPQPKRRRKPKASRQKARAEGFDESRGRYGAPFISSSNFFEAVGPLVQDHKRLSSATGRIAA
jgi:hypothetical protein